MQSTKTGRYLKYAIGEIILVVIGILIALQINNWNEFKKQRQKEIVYLTELKKALESDLKGEFIPGTIKYNRVMQGQKALNDFYNGTSTLSNDSLTKHFRSCLSNEWDFVFNTAAFENIKSTGIDIILNDSIRSKVSSLYSYNYPNIKEINQNYIRYYDQQISPMVNDNITLYDSILTDIELDYLKNTTKISNRIGQINNRRNFFLNRLIIPIRRDVETLIQDIDSELQRIKQ